MKMTSMGTVGSNRGIKVTQNNIFTNDLLQQIILQATESIITHLEKLDAPPEDDDEYQDETTDFTLFDVS